MKKYNQTLRPNSKIVDEAVGIVYSDFNRRFGFMPDEVIIDDDTERYIGNKRIINIRVGHTIFYNLLYEDMNGGAWGRWEMTVAKRIDFEAWSRERGM